MNATQTERYELTTAQLEQFDRDGFLVVDNVFSDADLQPVIDEVTVEIDRVAKECVARGELNNTFVEENFESRLAKISLQTDKVAQSVWNGSLAGPAFFNLIRNPRLLDVAEQFCGPELIASSVYRLRPKIPNHRQSPVPWHQDSGYMEPYCDNALVLTVWLPLVDATEENGCLWVIPGAHKGEVVFHGTNKGHPYLEIAPEHLPAGKPVCVSVRKGSVLMMTNRTPHASFENKTEIVRWSMDLRYQSAALPTNAPITRLPGEAIGKFGGPVPIACYPPEADFLIRSTLRPNEVVTDPAEFHRIRKTHLWQGLTPRWKVEPKA